MKTALKSVWRKVKLYAKRLVNRSFLKLDSEQMLTKNQNYHLNLSKTLKHVLHECIYRVSFNRNILISIFVLKYLLSNFQSPARTSPPTIPDASPSEGKIALRLSHNSCSETSPAEINVSS